MKTLNIIPDTNILLKGLLSHTNDERKVINLALSGKAAFYGSRETYAEFCRKLDEQPKLKKFMQSKRLTPNSLILTYRSIVTIVDPKGSFEGVSITRDPDDDVYFRIADYKDSQIIVTNDKDLHAVSPYNGIRAITAEKFIGSYVKWNGGKLISQPVQTQ